MADKKPRIRQRTRPAAVKTAGAAAIGHDPHRPIGYANPPASRQFKKGKSGNPKGRPKQRKSLQRILNETLFGLVSIREGGRTRKVTVIEALLMRLRKDALQGDIKATDRMMRIMQMQATQSLTEEGEDRPAFNPAEDQAILKEIQGWTKGVDLGGDLAVEDDEEQGGGS